MKNKNHNIRFNMEKRGRMQGVGASALPKDTADVQVAE
jgi:hypothetical protein